MLDTESRELHENHGAEVRVGSRLLKSVFTSQTVKSKYAYTYICLLLSPSPLHILSSLSPTFRAFSSNFDLPFRDHSASSSVLVSVVSGICMKEFGGGL